MAGGRKSAFAAKQKRSKAPQNEEDDTKDEKISQLQSLNKLLVQQINNLREEKNVLLKNDKEQKEAISDAHKQLSLFEENVKEMIGKKEEWNCEKQNLESSVLQVKEEMKESKEAWILEKEGMDTKMQELGEDLNSLRHDKYKTLLQLKETWDEMNSLSAEKNEILSQLKEIGEDIILLHSEKEKLLLNLNETAAKLISFNVNEAEAAQQSMGKLMKAKKKLGGDIVKKEIEFKAVVSEVETKWKESNKRFNARAANKEDELHAMISEKNKLEDVILAFKESKGREARNEIESLRAENSFLASEKMFLAWSLHVNK